MTTSERLSNLSALLAAMQKAATALSCGADSLTPGDFRRAFNLFADSLEAAAAYAATIQPEEPQQ